MNQRTITLPDPETVGLPELSDTAAALHDLLYHWSIALTIAAECAPSGQRTPLYRLSKRVLDTAQALAVTAHQADPSGATRRAAALRDALASVGIEEVLP